MTKVIEKKLGRWKRYGQTDKVEGADIHVDPRQRPKTRLGTVIHELLHQAIPEFKEARILRIEKHLRNGLWDDNYRQTKQ